MLCITAATVAVGLALRHYVGTLAEAWPGLEHAAPATEWLGILKTSITVLKTLLVPSENSRSPAAMRSLLEALIFHEALTRSLV